MANQNALGAYAQWYPNHKKPLLNIPVRTGTPLSNVTSGIVGAASGLEAGAASISRASITAAKPFKRFIEQDVGGSIAGVVTGISQTNNFLIGGLQDVSDTIRQNLQPVSSFMGSTLGTLTGMINDPLGSNGVGNVLTNMFNNASPGFGNKINGTIANLNLQGLANLPAQIFSSIDHLITAVDNLLAVPLSFLAEIYYGYVAIMQAISKLISNLINGFIQFLFDFLDSIIPIKSILALLDAVSGLANQIGGIANTFLGANVISGFTNQITNFTSQIGNILSNPLDLVVSVLPQQFSQIMYTLQNPQQLINQYLPPQLSQAFSTISSMAGFGFNGNMGYGLQSVLQGVQGGVVRSILTNYASQYSALAPILGGLSNSGIPKAQQANQGYDAQLIQDRYSRAWVDENFRRPVTQWPGGP